jgi:hypothetical protein
MRTRTTDKAGADVYTVQQIGRTQEVTPEGFLLCRDVRIARIGEMFYAADELPELEAGPDGIIRATRGPEDLFRPETIASALGKSVTDDHPDEDVSPENWEELSGGVLLNPHQGEGADAEYLLADLLIQKAAVIAAVRAGKREVSLGYDADYEQLGPGKARQFNIIVNHVALVDHGRCGPRCAIGDHDMKTRDQKKRTWKDRILTAFKARDEDALAEALNEAPTTDEGEGLGGGDAHLVIELKGAKPAEGAASGAPTGDEGGQAGGEEVPAWFKQHADSSNARLDKIEGVLAKILGGGTQDEFGAGAEGAGAGEGEGGDTGPLPTDDEEIDLGQAGEEDKGEKGEKGEKTRDRTCDAATLVARFRDTIARAEILAPGIKLPTLDGKATRKQTIDRMCALRRRALQAATENAETAEVVSPLLAGRTLSAVTCDSVEPLFVAASEIVKRQNSSVTTISRIHDHQGGGSAPVSIAAMNERNRKFWASKGGLIS